MMLHVFICIHSTQRQIECLKTFSKKCCPMRTYSSNFPMTLSHRATSIAFDIRDVSIVNFHLCKNPFHQENSNTFVFQKTGNVFFIRNELSVFEFQLTDNVTIFHVYSYTDIHCLETFSKSLVGDIELERVLFFLRSNLRQMSIFVN